MPTMLKTFEEKAAGGGAWTLLSPNATTFGGACCIFIARTWVSHRSSPIRVKTALSGNFNIPVTRRKIVLGLLGCSY